MTQTRVIWEEESSIHEPPPSDWPAGKSVGHLCVGVPPTVGGAIPGQAVLGAIRKQAQQARRRPMSSVSPRSLRQLLP